MRFEKREFFVIGKEAQAFEEMVKGPWMNHLETAKGNRPTQETCGIYKITVDCAGYYLDGVWHPEFSGEANAEKRD